MTSQPDQQRELPWMKTPEQEINSENIWEGDALNRSEMARNLANMVADPRGLSTISIHGGWGTGKTFFLERLRWHLKENGFEAIYFNAWQDDFFNDPLLAILGQLANKLASTENRQIAKTALNVAGALATAVGTEVLRQYTGINLRRVGKSIPRKRQTVADQYATQAETRRRLRNNLSNLADGVTKESDGKPLVFIIDELDRCRPTFAIELMERVKHIFDVSNVLFIFGVNRDEMAKSLQSIYGNIDADTYLRRFFDLELSLPPADTKTFTRHLINSYELPAYFDDLFKGVQRPPDDNLGTMRQHLPYLLDALQVSLREAQYCVRLLSVLARSQNPRELMMPVVVVGLTALRTVNRKLYRDFVRGDVRTGEVIDWLDERASERLLARDELRQWNHILSVIEAQFYRSDLSRRAASDAGASLDAELNKLGAGEEIIQPTFVSRRLASLGQDEARRVHEIVTQPSPYYEGDAVSKIASMLDLSAQYIRE